MDSKLVIRNARLVQDILFENSARNIPPRVNRVGQEEIKEPYALRDIR